MPAFASYARWTAVLIASLALGVGLWEARSTAAGPDGDEASPTADPPTVKVAALNYRGVSAKELGCPGDDACALEVLVRKVASRGAALVVAPEYGLIQFDPEPEPKVGSKPSDPKAVAQVRFAKLADELDLYLVINLHTFVDKKIYNTQIAFDPTGHVVALHHKFELFEGEREVLTAGDQVSAFDTPFGRVGLLICADMYGDPDLHHRLTQELDVDIVAISSQWTVPVAPRWLAAFAHDWGVYVVGANSSVGAGGGGAVVDPSGKIVARSGSLFERWPVVVATIPVPRGSRDKP